MFPIKDHYDEVFAIEIDGWCFGLTNYPGEVSPQVVHRIVRELQTSFQAAIEHNVVFDILGISQKISQAARFLVHEKEIALAIVAQLPNPAILLEEQQCVLGMIIDRVEATYGGALEGFYKRWQLGPKREAA
jgi:hypothetical protein